MYADEISKKIEAVKKEIHDTPYDKSSQFHHGVLKAKLAKYNDMLEAKVAMGGGGTGGGGYAIKHSGDASVVLVGLPSVGKSTLLNAITNAESKVGNYDFTTLGVVPGMMEYKGVRIQILDLPGIIEGAAGGKGFGRKVLSVVRASNLVVLMTDYQRANWLSKVKKELEDAGMRLNKRPPKIHVHKMAKGAIQIIDPYFSLPAEQILEIVKEMGFDNVVVQFGEKINSVDELIDGLSKSRTYIPLVEVVTKMDTIKNYELRITNFKKDGIVGMAADKGIGIEEFKEAVWKGLGLVRVYLKRERVLEADRKEPLIMKKTDTLNQVLKRISSEMRDDVSRACIWGKNARFPGQEVSFKSLVFDEMEVWFGR
ncbi:GTP-binding protein [Candidatus Shapirobacteria bacterium CG10_big_fil_rev_8_21_14_0_10_36_6]|uniref:GTP-binding protein n=1 Tax=Candidatus Shapirobacteria bacterium CG10_big_fil_rev_8_21_14_0_10_36_6 TaxID=1974886 RepID=A0A2M8L2T0_9BACT|nr:MAG: GTP-binding protein [Candidatus Shapirobacteria bacterium CG10_big_fil_rev_8_21_14_0_10_36_6]